MLLFFFFFVISSFYLSTLLSENVKLIHVFQYAISIPISRRTFNCSSPRSWYKCEIPFSFEMSYCLLINTSFKPWYLVPSYSHWNSCWSLSSILALFRYLFFPIFNFLALQLFTLFHNSYLFNLLWEILGMKSRGKAKNCTEMGSYFLLINWKFQNSSSTPPMNYYYVNSVYLKVHQLWVVALQTHLNYQFDSKKNWEWL